MKKRLIVCPNCEQAGTINILGELKPDGSLAILRFHQGETIIAGDAFVVVCGKCKRPIYIRNCRNKTMTNWTYYWQHWEKTA